MIHIETTNKQSNKKAAKRISGAYRRHQKRSRGEKKTFLRTRAQIKNETKKKVEYLLVAHPKPTRRLTEGGERREQKDKEKPQDKEGLILSSQVRSPFTENRTVLFTIDLFLSNREEGKDGGTKKEEEWVRISHISVTENGIHKERERERCIHTQTHHTRAKRRGAHVGSINAHI